MTEDFLQVPYDDWNKKLDNQIVILKKCQEEKGYDSCSSCTYIVECETRKQYVKSVYESMNKGNTGGFEF